MSLDITKAQVTRVLEDKDNKVVALSGKWGTGKSFMWAQIQMSSDKERIKDALYVSLFGLSDINQVKLKLIQSAAPIIGNSKSWEAIKAGTTKGLKLLESVHHGFGVLGDVGGVLLAPVVLGGKLIVIDDIERKHERLHIDEVLGFIDEFNQQHGSHFLLILNSDRLEERTVWETLREKVIDQEIRLNTSTSEAFTIAVGGANSTYAAHIKIATEVCGLTNVRVIRKVIKVVETILSGHSELSDSLLSRVIPSTVLLSAIHYKGLEDGPDFNFVLSYGSPNWEDFFDSDGEDSNTKGDDEKSRRSKWRMLLAELHILICDDYELLVVEFLQSGLFDSSKISEVIARYVAENDAIEALNSCKSFIEKLVWDHTTPDTLLLVQAKALVGQTHLLDCYTMTSLYDHLCSLPGGESLAEESLNGWIDNFRAKDLAEVRLDNSFGRKVNSRIESEFAAVNRQVQANMSAFDACIYLTTNSGWGPRQEAALNAASVQDMESIIREKSVPDMRAFVTKMMQLCIQKDTYGKHFGHAMRNFAVACSNIVQDPNSGKLGKLMHRLFIDYNLTGLLNVTEVPPPSAIQ